MARNTAKHNSDQDDVDSKHGLGSSSHRNVLNKTHWRPVISILFMLAIDATGYCLALAPQTRLIEDIVCRQHYAAVQPGAVPSEDMCKSTDVQEIVAQLFGWAVFFDGIPGLALAMYYGALADKHGRRRVLFFSMFGQVLGMAWVLFVCWRELPLKLIWLSSVFLTLGGGSTVTAAVCMMVVADSTLEGDRSIMFFYAQAVTIIGELLGPWMGSALMEHSLWIPLLLALGCTSATAVIAGSIPETLQLGKTRTAKGKLQDDAIDEDKTEQANSGSLRSLFQHTFNTLRFIVRHRSVLLVVITFLVMDYSRQSLSLLLRYVSTRFSMPIAQANLLLSFKAFVQLFACVILLPLLDRLLVRRLELSPRLKDLSLARLSIAFVMACFLFLFIAPGVWAVVIALVFYTLGSGFGSFSRSLVSSLVEPDMTGTLFTTLSIMDTLGSLLAGPVVAATFSWSLHLNGVWRGLPYVFSFILCMCATFALSQVRTEDIVAGESVPSEDEESTAMLTRREEDTL